MNRTTCFVVFCTSKKIKYQYNFNSFRVCRFAEINFGWCSSNGDRLRKSSQCWNWCIGVQVLQTAKLNTTKLRLISCLNGRLGVRSYSRQPYRPNPSVLAFNAVNNDYCLVRSLLSSNHRKHEQWKRPVITSLIDNEIGLKWGNLKRHVYVKMEIIKLYKDNAKVSKNMLFCFLPSVHCCVMFGLQKHVFHNLSYYILIRFVTKSWSLSFTTTVDRL